ncbi:MAG: hypothetical protein IKK74_07925 [Clostridia bacterium]|nr:hypothetical protein [Clostridia bacterium]
MIKFEGKVSDQSKQNMRRFQMTASFSYSLLVGMPFALIIIFSLYAVLTNTVFPNLDLWLVLVVGLLLFLAFSVLPMQLYSLEKVKAKNCPQILKFSYETEYDNEFFYKDELNQEFYKYTNDVSKIIEYENMYIIVFSSLIGTGIVAQKDLLVEGTLEEFEKLFEGKIIRKIK